MNLFEFLKTYKGKLEFVPKGPDTPKEFLRLSAPDPKGGLEFKVCFIVPESNSDSVILNEFIGPAIQAIENELAKN